MAIQDTFIGNLRGSRDIATGLASPVQKPGKQKVEIPKNVDQPASPLRRSIIGAIREVAPHFSDDIFVSREPLSYGAVQRVSPYRDMFAQALSEYSNEADREKRLQILDNYGLNTPLGSLPGTGQYLQIMRNTEEVAGRENIDNYKYKETAESFLRKLDAEIAKFNPRA